MIPPNYFLLVAAALFALGAVGVLVRRNALVCLLALVLMFNAAGLVFAVFGRLYGDGQALALLGLAASAAGVAVGVALGVVLFRRRRTLDAADLDRLRW